MATDQNIEIDGVNLHYTDTGEQDKNAVMIMHGWGCDVTTVASIEAALADGKRIIRVDLPGHGTSSEPPLLPDGSPWGVYEFADIIEKLIGKLKLVKPSLVGHSYGGRVAIILGSRMALDKIVLVDSAGIKPKRKPKYYFKVYSFKVMKKLLPIILGRNKAEKIIERRRNKSGSADYRNATPVMRMVMSKSVNQDLRHLLPKISVPTLLIWGENDKATPISDAKLMEKLIPDAGLVSFKGAGHYSFLDKPAQFRAVVRSFLIKN